MRFLEDGPDIPGDLLEARDQGSVVFFCGSGVSRAYANLPDFFGLAQDVLDELRVPDDSDAAVVFREAKEIGSRVNVSGLLSADLVFGLLERRYAVVDIRSAVARCIGRRIQNTLTAHNLLMRLAKTPAHRTQLITTNFDRLFSDCDTSIANYVSPRLPQLTEFEPLDGIVYLHGRLNADYTDAELDTVVLSPADFGHAYLSAGWATEFFRKVARRFTVVFVGYSGDDPPIRYLLEGLHRNRSQSGTLFALQHDESEEALSKWRSKGVTPVAFPSFETLWSTLSQWADRADNPPKWRERVIALASQSPRSLKAHERGQVTQLVSSFEGAKEFLAAQPSSEWLCVFDSKIRFNRGSQTTDNLQNETPESPFDKYGLDSDPIPPFAERNNRYEIVEIPTSLIDVLKPNNTDLSAIAEGVRSKTTIFTSKVLVPLPKRLQCLAEWIAQSANETATLWWAMRQHDLHPDIKSRLRWRIIRSDAKLDNGIAQRWSQLLDVLDASETSNGMGWYEFTEHIRKNGWSYTALRLFSKVIKHAVEIEKPILSDFEALPPLTCDGITVDDICRIKLEIPQIQPGFDVPDEWVFVVSQQLVQSILQIELACNEYDCKYELDLCPLHIDPNPEIDRHRRITGVSGLLNLYLELFTRLLKMDLPRARAGYLAWPSDSVVFDRLKIWALSNNAIVPDDKLVPVVNSIAKDLLWDSYARRDLLVSLRQRWATIPTLDKTKIEQLLLDGPPMWEQEDDCDFDSRRKYNTAMVLTWLQLQRCDLSSSTLEELKRIKSEVPEWSDSYADRAADSREVRGGWVRTDTGFNGLQDLPVAEVIEAARQLAGRSTGSFLVEKDPFTGYCTEYPQNALEALKLESDKGKCAVAEWNKFLDSKLRADDSIAFQHLIADALLATTDECLAELSYYSSWWFKDHFRKLVQYSCGLTEQLLDKFVDVINRFPQCCDSAVSANREDRDWMMEAINSCVGRVAEAVVESYFSEDALDKRKHLDRLKQLLSQQGTIRQHTLTILSQNLIWFYRKDMSWTENSIIAALLETETLDGQAAWSGLLWSPKLDDKLFPRLKLGLLELAKRQSGFRRGHLQSISGLLLSGWLPNGTVGDAQQVTDQEFHDVLLSGGREFQTQILWYLQHDLSKSPHARDSLLPSVVKLLSQVWPKEIEVRSPAISASLLDMLMVDETTFKNLIDVALPCLTTLTKEQRYHFHFQEEAIKPVIDGNPDKFLAMLVKILPEEPEFWPYGFGNTLQLIVTAKQSLKADRRFESLQQRWNKVW